MGSATDLVKLATPRLPYESEIWEKIPSDLKVAKDEFFFLTLVLFPVVEWMTILRRKTLV